MGRDLPTAPDPAAAVVAPTIGYAVEPRATAPRNDAERSNLVETALDIIRQVLGLHLLLGGELGDVVDA